MLVSVSKSLTKDDNYSGEAAVRNIRASKNLLG
jgi:hypothetical protein